MRSGVVAVSILCAGVLLANCTNELPGIGKTIYVAAHRVSCEGVGTQQCLQIKEDPDANWTLWYDEIKGFTHEEGFEFVLLVQEETQNNPPADGSSISLQLIDIVSKTAVEEPEGVASLVGTSWRLTAFGADSLSAPDAEVTLAFTDSTVTGTGGCNQYFGSYTAGPDGDFLIGPVGSTRMMCPEPAMGQEGYYLQALDLIRSLRVEEATLLLLSEGGEPALVYEKLEDG